MGAFLGSKVHGLGQHLDLSLFEIMVGSQDRAVQAHTTFQYTGVANTARSGGGAGRNLLPNGPYPCADGYVQMFAMRPVWKEACLMVERPDLIDDPHFLENFTGNPEVRAEFEAILLEWMLPKTKQEVMEKAQAADYLCGAMNAVDEVYRDPHLAERRFFVDIDHPYTGPVRYPGPPFKMEKTPWRPGRAPLLGEHTAEVLCGRLGYAPEEIARLREQGAI
jgi:crotonobetainyl-CoA:carnitine CoA-transferase CaiB-like acyl-CoA transferase